MKPLTAFLGKSLIALVVLSPAAAWAQAVSNPPADERPTGLPARVNWTFNFDGGWGSFGFANSYYNNPKDPVPENLSDQWFEGFIKPALSGNYTFHSSSQLYGKISAVGERTYGQPPEAFGHDVGSFGPDEAFIGWRSGKSVGSDENVISLSVGRQFYKLGHGMLLWDGASEGGSRGGFWTNARKAFAFAAIARIKTQKHMLDGFYLDKDDLPENQTGTRLSGVNYEFSPSKTTTLGVTYMKFASHADVAPKRDGLNVFNVRAYTAPIPHVQDLSFEFEYATERNGDVLHSDAWTLQGAYQFSGVSAKPKISYRYALFEGDDPATKRNEAFDPLLPGFYDWGTWWQGEIAGEYFLSNSNLGSQELRAHFTPSTKVGAGVIFYKFRIDQPQSYGPGVTDHDAAFETDFYTDWKANKNVTISLVGAFADPGPAIEQATGRTKNFAYGMAYIAYSF